MMVATPPVRSIRKACSDVSLSPSASKEIGHTAAGQLFDLFTGSPSAAFTTSVAPKCLARLSFEPLMSIAMIRPAPAIAAPLIADNPTPPQPITATVPPTSTLAVWITAPNPVVTPQPINAARFEGHVLPDFHQRMFVHQQLLRE